MRSKSVTTMPSHGRLQFNPKPIPLAIDVSSTGCAVAEPPRQWPHDERGLREERGTVTHALIDRFMAAGGYHIAEPVQLFLSSA
jgi:hypothetical protein